MYSYPDPYYIVHFRDNTLEADSILLDEKEYKKLSKNKKIQKQINLMLFEQYFYLSL